ncbi:DNA polymerase III subunit alpha [Rubrimonas cliftonensis]|uniref:DNA polymerase III subunit alpha n=1 Tax=Rubrimonas cliftonensis TaxID=89524 RepID=A0A1H3YFQ6_9RHOB|nr:DNA polymerase III subunit alpha [Rubrimonas cliftonensis]SEA10430.1 DNA polymerase III, alpha subunit [Rubrimonas cliftonensis]
MPAAPQPPSAAAPSFVHLRVRSVYSLGEGAIGLKALPKLCEAAGCPAVAVADANNLFGALEFSETAAKAGVQPIIGLSLALAYAEADRPGDRAPEPAEIALYAQDEAGYRNLMALSSHAYLTGVDGRRAVGPETLAACADGLILLTGGPDGPLGRLARAGRRDAALALLDRLEALFPDRLYVELQRHGEGETLRTPAEEETEPFFVETAYARDLPLVASNDAHFPDAAMYAAHDAFLCVGSGSYVTQENRPRLTPEHWFKPASAMVERFADLPEACANTVEIARRCAFRPRTCAPILPRFADDEVEELRRQAREGLAERLRVVPPAAERKIYEDRLDYELGVIEGMGFPGYFLIVADFIKWSKAQDIPVGPGRGSGAGSLVAWALTITDLDPLRYGLLFERFLNPDRVSMPDFDIDFCMDRREEVIAYVQRRYGADRVAQIITFGAMLSKAAVRDVGRVLQLPYGQVDRLSKMIPVEGVKPVSVKRARAEEPRLQEAAKEEPVVAELLDIAEKVEGLLRNASTHAAGVVIGDRPLVELCPLYRDARAETPATQFNMKWVEQAGLVKFDFLGLKTLTVIQNALDLLKKRGVSVDISAIPLDDPKTYELYARADTVAVFQVESAGMRDALRQLRPTCIEDIVALVALYRPGPMENIPKYCNVKNGREPRAGIHPLIDPILDETQGIIVYQEQVMEIARKMAGYSLGGADLLRRAMGKKIQEAMDAERPKFLEGAAENGVDGAKALEVWNLLDKFANYGFNKSHAAAYAVVSYQTAWLKANHPVEFMAAVMNCDIHLTDKLAVYKREADAMGIATLAPCVNRSEAGFTVSDGAIVYALGGLKGVGPEAMRLIATERAQAGRFVDVFDLARRVDLRRIGKRALEMIARAGAFDALDRNRRRMLAAVDQLLAYSAAAQEEAASNQVSLFGGVAELPAPRLSDGPDWDAGDRLAEEFTAVGFYLSGHPLDDVAQALRRKKIHFYRELAALASRSGVAVGRIAGVVMKRQEKKSARGARFAFVALSDPTGMYEATVFSDVLAAHRDLLEPGCRVVMTVEAEPGGDQLKLLCKAVAAVETVIADAAAAGLRVHLSDQTALAPLRARLEPVRAERGAGAGAGGVAGRRGGPVEIVVADPALGAEIAVRLPDAWAVTPAIRGAIKAIDGVLMVEDL